MDLLIAPNTVPQSQADVAPPSGTPGWATNGNPSTGVPATTLAAYEFNAMMAELTNAIAAAGLTPSRFDNTQLAQAMRAMWSPIGAVTKMATSRWSQSAYPNFVPCDGLTTKPLSSVDPTLGAQFQNAAFMPTSLPQIGVTSFNAAGMAWNGSVWCAVGGTSALLSPDGVAWARVQLPGTSPYTDIAWNGATFCAISASGVALSANGTQWTQYPLPVSQSWQSVIWAGGRFVAIGGASLLQTVYVSQTPHLMQAITATSPDGISWTLGAPIPSVYSPHIAIAYANGTYCLIADQYSAALTTYSNENAVASVTLTSTDGLNWTANAVSNFLSSSNPSGGRGIYIASNGSNFLVASSIPGASYTAGNFYTSTDGKNWVLTLGNGTIFPQIEDSPRMIWAGSFFIYAGTTNDTSGNQYGNAFVTANGSAVNSISIQNVNTGAIGWNGADVLLIGNTNASSQSQAAISPNGTSWTYNSLMGPGSSNVWAGIAFGNSRYVAISAGSNIVATSTDGKNWSFARSLPSSANWTDIAWNGSVFLVVASGSNVAATSPDGLTWTTQTLPTSAAWTAIAVFNGAFVVIASGTTTVINSRTNGTTWTSGAMPSAATWSALAANGTRLVAMSGSTSSAVSTDGLTWTAATALAGANAIAWDGTNFCAVGNSGTAQLTTNGTAWTSVSMPANANWTAIASDGHSFVAIASNTTQAAMSTNHGSTWSALVLPNAANWIGLATDGATHYVATSGGNNGNAAWLDDSALYFLAPSVPANDARFINIMRVI